MSILSPFVHDGNETSVTDPVKAGESKTYRSDGISYDVHYSDNISAPDYIKVPRDLCNRIINHLENEFLYEAQELVEKLNELIEDQS